MSKRQQKKQVLREARQERKGVKKAEKQVEALNAALKSLKESLERHLKVQLDSVEQGLAETFGPSEGYESLKMAYGPRPEEGLELLSSVLIRPKKYNEKFLPQEYSLLHKLWLLKGDGILDIGAGNANCAVLCSSLLRLPVLCVERESPRMELRAEELLPRRLRQVERWERDVKELTAAEIKEVARSRGVRRFVLCAKHPCGIGVDRSIACACELADSVCGVVIATCCCNKLSLDDFRESRVMEFCELNREQLGEVTEDLISIVELMSKCSAWRTCRHSLGNGISASQVAWAEAFEGHLQSCRLRKLREAFGFAEELRFAPSACTLQDRCLVAAREDLDLQEDGGFLDQLRRGALELLEAHGPIDCRPKGLKSAKYDFDYTKD